MPHSLFPAATPEVRAQLERDDIVKLIHDFDWAATPAGPLDGWPESVRGAVRLMLTAPMPIVLMLGPTGILIYNQPYAEFAGQRHPQILGLPALEAWPEVAAFNRHKIALGMAGDSLILHDQELLLNRHGAMEAAWLDLNYSPLLGDDGLPVGTLCIVSETTTRILAEKALARSEERLSLALNGTNLVGTWDWDVTRNVVSADDRFAALFNIDPLRAGIGVEIESFTAAIHPDDAVRVAQEIGDALATGEAYRSEYRVVSPAGQVRWIVASGRPLADQTGHIVRFPGVVVDVTEQKLIAEALAVSEQNFRILADTMPQMVWSTLPDGFHDYYNARWYEFTGVPAGSTDGEGWNDMFHPDDRDRAWATWRKSLETGAPYQIEYRLRHHTGAYRWTLGLALPTRDAAGSIVRWFGTCTDIHEARLAAAERELVTQELSHRIKNIFAVLNSIVGLSVRNQPEIKPFADKLRQRIFALGEAHNFVRPHSRVSQTRRDERSLWALIEQLLSPYQDEDKSRVEFVGEDAKIDEGAATPLALLIHELGTNAAKYGALSADNGRVVIKGSTAGDQYRLSWKELGGPPVTPSGEPGFGSRLISLSVEGQMRGVLERFWECDGLRIDLTLPLDALSQSGRLQS